MPDKCSGNDIKVSVEYCGVNFADVYHALGKLIEKPTPYVMGLECVGEIVEMGSEVTDFKVSCDAID